MNENPYIPDLLENGLFALTRKNAKFLSAVVRIDSKYKGDEKNIDNKLKRLKTSKNFESDFNDFIIEINKTHSTRVSEDIIKLMTKKIIDKYENWKKLEEGLNKDFKSCDENHPISILTKPISENKGENCQLSLASKIAHFFKKDKYPKYDDVMARNLVYYLKIYLNKDIPENTFKIKYNKQDRYHNYLKIYDDYIKNLKELLKCSEIAKHDFCFSDLDVIIWYSKKGK